MATESSVTLKTIEEDSLGQLIEISLAAQKQRDNLQQAEVLSKNQAQLFLQTGQDAALVNEVQSNAKLTAQKHALRVANAVGIDPKATSDEMIEIMTQMRENNKKVRDNLQAYNQKKERGVFNGGPLNWISNLVDIESTYNKVETGIQTSEILTGQLNNINSAVQQSTVTTNAIAESVTTASIDASNRMILNEAQLKANQSFIEGLKYNSQGITVAREASREQLNTLYNLKSAQNAELQLNRSLDALNQQKKEFNWRMEEERVKEAAKAEAKEMDSYILEMISIGRGNRGAAPLDQRAARTMLQLFKSGGAASKELYKDFTNGETSKVIGVPVLGTTPADSVETLEILGTTVASVREETLGLLKQAKDLVATNRTIDPKNKDQVAQAFNKQVQDLILQQYRTVTSGSGNIFDLGDLRSYLGNSTDDKMGVSSLKNLGISQKVLIPAIEANLPMNNPRDVLNLSISAVQKGQITSTEFLELADVYRKANEINLASRNLIGFGIVPPNAGKNHFVKISAFGGTIDMTDYQALSRKLSEELAQSILQSRRTSPFTVN